MNSKEDILNNGQLEGLKSYTIFKRKTPGFKRYNCENLKVLDKWYLKICKNTSPKINCKYWFGVVGFLRDGTLLQSSPILEIESPKILITENSRYKLEGNNDLRKNVPHSEFSREELNKFLNGFPKDWMNIFRIELEKIYGKNLYNPEKEIKVEMNREMDKLYENLIEEKKKEGSKGDKVKVRDKVKGDKVKVDKRDSSLLKGDSSLVKDKTNSFKGDSSLLKGDSLIKGDSSLLKGDSSLVKRDSSLVKDSMIKSNNSNLNNSNLNKPLRVDSIKKDEIKKQDNNYNKDLIQDFFNDNKTTWIPKKPNKNYNQNWNKNHNQNRNYKRTIYDNKNLEELQRDSLQRDSLQRDSLENVLDELLVAQKEIDGFLLKDDQKKTPKEIEWLPKGKNEERNEERNEGILSKSMEGKNMEDKDKSKGFIGDLSKSMEEKESDYKKINRESKEKDNTKDNLTTLINPKDSLIINPTPNNPLNKLDYDVEGIFEDIFKETSSKKTNEKEKDLKENNLKGKEIMDNKNIIENEDIKDNKDIMDLMDNIGEGLIKDLDKEIKENVKEKEDGDEEVKGEIEGLKEDRVKDLIEPKDNPTKDTPTSKDTTNPPKDITTTPPLFDLDFIPDLSFHSLDLDSSKIFLSKDNKTFTNSEPSPKKRQKEEEEEIVRSYIKEMDGEKEKEYVFDKRRKLEKRERVRVRIRIVRKVRVR